MLTRGCPGLFHFLPRHAPHSPARYHRLVHLSPQAKYHPNPANVTSPVAFCSQIFFPSSDGLLSVCMCGLIFLRQVVLESFSYSHPNLTQPSPIPQNKEKQAALFYSTTFGLFTTSTYIFFTSSFSLSLYPFGFFS